MRSTARIRQTAMVCLILFCSTRACVPSATSAVSVTTLSELDEILKDEGVARLD